MQPEKRRSVTRIPGGNMQQYLACRRHHAGQYRQDRNTVVRRADTKTHIQHQADAHHNKGNPLQQTQRAGQLVQNQLPAERKPQNPADTQQGECVQAVRPAAQAQIILSHVVVLPHAYREIFRGEVMW